MRIREVPPFQGVAQCGVDALRARVAVAVPLERLLSSAVNGSAIVIGPLDLLT